MTCTFVTSGAVFGKLLLVVGDAVAVVVVLDSSPDGLFSQDGAVELMGLSLIHILERRSSGVLPASGSSSHMPPPPYRGW